MHVAAQHCAIGIVHRVDNAGSHAAVLLAARSCCGGLGFRVPAAEGQRYSANQNTSTPASFLDFHKPPSYRICLASPISIDADSTIEQTRQHDTRLLRRLIKSEFGCLCLCFPSLICS
jgi:hypothetical protein